MIITGYVLKNESKKTYFITNATFVAAPRVTGMLCHFVLRYFEGCASADRCVI
jgi:hypothetical protein